MAPDSRSSTSPAAPTGRLRLAAALGGAGVLAAGLGAGVWQSHAQDATSSTAPGETALGAAQPTTVAPAPGAAAEGSAVTATATSTQTATVTGTAPAPAPAPAPPAAAPEQPAPADLAPAPVADASAATPDATAAPAPALAPAPDPATGDDTPEPQIADPKGEPQDDPAPKPARRHPRKAAARTHAGKEPKTADTPVRVDPTPAPAPIRTPQGVPTIANPTTSIALPGPAAVGVPNFFIDKFRIPPFLLSIYQAAGTQYGIRWEVLAAINEIETDYGRNLNVSSAGALGWMQFMPATWKQYGVDANGDGRKDPFNPVDAIFAAARYLKAAGGDTDLRRAIFAYNHADWYVESVLMRARLVGGLPSDLVGSLTGLTEGRFPVAAKARYADDLDERRAQRRVAVGRNAALPVESSASRSGILIFADSGSAAVSTHDGRVVSRGRTKRLGRYVRVRDTYGNTYTYGHLGSLSASFPVAKRGAKPEAASAAPADDTAGARSASATSTADVAPRERLFAHPTRPLAFDAGGSRQVDTSATLAPRGREDYVRELLHLKPSQVRWKRLEKGSTIVAGTVLGRIGRSEAGRAPHLLFEIRPAGRGAPRIDPKPILDGWKLLESTAIYRAKGTNPFFGKDAKAPTVGEILLMSKETLQRRVLADPRISIYAQGREDVRAGRVDRRVLATLAFLSGNGLRPTVSSMFRPGAITVSGNVSEHSTGTAVDIAAINGTPIIGNQGNGSITDVTIRRLLTLQGVMKPHQIISLMQYPNADNTLAMADHNDHIHVGYRPVSGQGFGGLNAVLKPGQWLKVIDRLSEIENPVVPATPSKASIKVTPKRYGNAGSRSRRAD